MSAPTRRRLLAAASIGALAGCIEGMEPSGGSSDDPESDDPGSDGAPTTSSPPGDTKPDSCPTYGDNVDRVVCYDDVDDAETVLEPDDRCVDDGDSIAFTLENGSDERLQTNFYNWRIDKYVDDEWYRVAPMGHNDPLMSIEPGESHTWTVTVDQSGDDDGELPVGSGGTEALTLPAVGAGTYAFRARGWFDGDSHEESLAFATTFDLAGDRLELTPSDAISDTKWEDDALVAHSTRGDPDDDNHRLGAFDLERVSESEVGTGDGGDEGPESVITEQLFRQPRLRDVIALSIENDADEVRLEEYDATHPIFGAQSDGLYEFQGEYYRISTRELEE
ncbi:hypothetical protein SAMN04487967_1060 [Natronorubrum sediminis]|uniref:Bacterial Ig-like domain-containing protein n=1 Tax=Natronorubrum sediminis TaxID=640943 RepID=A0A1H6FPZ0_9EURY|nr:immunoglobulin-like domain-containing protein [Natronorubrum sediminis]SEH12967.1 hypothetical protein SAMN04487967_1060 [Natronorubrum sediminis]